MGRWGSIFLPFLEGFIIGDPIVVSGGVQTGGCGSVVSWDIQSKGINFNE